MAQSQVDRPFHLRSVSLQLLRDWEGKREFAVDLIEGASQRFPLEARQRAALQNLVYTTIRNQRILDFLIGELTDRRPDTATRRVLRQALCESWLLGGADHAVVDEHVKLAGRARPMVNAVLRRWLRERPQMEEIALSQPPDIRWSVPTFIWKRWTREFSGEECISLAQWNHTTPPTFLRVRRDFHPSDSSLNPVPNHPDYFQVMGTLPHHLLQSGVAYVQDPSTSKAIRLLELGDANRILDACAAPGGKSFAIYQQSPDSANLVCTDHQPKRILRLNANLQRLGLLDRVKVQQHDWFQEHESSLGAFDRILVDAPCSNTGVIRRRIDVPWRLSREDFRTLPTLQLSILSNASKLLQKSPKARLVYSTCSIDRAENEEVTKAFLHSHPSFALVEETCSLPWRDGFDGAYAAAFKLRSV